MAITSEVPDTVPLELTGERCDRCGGRAQFRVEVSTGELFFCATHHRQYADKLAQCVKVPRAL